MKPSPTPSNLGPRGAAFWRSVMDAYELSDTETPLLLEACRTLDTLDALDVAVREHGAMTVGSMGQPVVNPALTEARGQRLALHRLLSALALPDDEGNAIPTGAQLRGIASATKRWTGHTSEASLKALGA